MEDGEIIRMYWQRDEAAITATWEKYGGYCTGIAKNILGDEQDAEECTSDTMLRAWDAMPPHKPRLLSAFLGKITRNLALNRYKRGAARKRGGGQASRVFEEMEELVSGKDGVEQEADYKELVREIDRFLEGLKPDKRGIFLCRYWYFDSTAEIAARFALSENNVSVTLSRLRRQLGRYLTERGFVL